MKLTAIFLALLAVSPTSWARAAQECPTGVFPTDPREIATLYARSAETADLPAGEPIEITRIRNGLTNRWAGAFINDGLQTWSGYDADRHLFVNVQGSTGRGDRKPDAVKLGPDQAFRQQGVWGYVVTTAAATPAQARRFACLANALLNTPPPTPDPLIAHGMSDTAALQHQVVAGGKIVREANGDESLFQWVNLASAEPIGKSMGTWLPPHVQEVVVDGDDNIYALLNPGGVWGRWVHVLEISRSGRVSDRSALTPDPYIATSFAVDRAGRVLLPTREGDIYELPPGISTPDKVGQRKLHLKETGLFQGMPWIGNFAPDRHGNLYASSTSGLIRITPDGHVTAIAGNGNQGHDDGVGAAASFFFPAQMAVAPSGDVFVVDQQDSIIRKVTPGGVVTTLAGLAGQVGVEDGQGAAARFNHPRGIAVDRQGIIYVADTDNHVIRRISPLGEVTTFAGAAAVSGTTDGNGTGALLDHPASIAVDSHGTLYVICAWNKDNIIRTISAQGRVSSWNVQKWIRPLDIDTLL